jgi:hypothetical protein
VYVKEGEPRRRWEDNIKYKLRRVNLGVDGRIILKCKLEKQGVRKWTGSNTLMNLRVHKWWEAC